MAKTVQSSQPFIQSQEQLQALMQHPAFRKRILPYQLLVDKMTPVSRWGKLTAWISQLLFAAKIPEVGSAAHLRDRLIALRINARGLSPEGRQLTREEKDWYKTHQRDEFVGKLLMPGQTEVLVKEVADALEKRLEVVQSDLHFEDWVIQPDDWREKRQLMANLIHLTSPTLSLDKKQEIGKGIQELYQRGLNEKIELIASSCIQWSLSLRVVHSVLASFGIDPESPLSKMGIMQASVYTSQHLAENTDFLPAKATLFGTNMVFLWNCFKSIQLFATGGRALASAGAFDAMQMASGASILMSYCPWKTVASRVRQAASLVFVGCNTYVTGATAYTGLFNLAQFVKGFFLDQCPNPNFRES